MREVVMQTEEPDSTREATDQMEKIPDSTYAKAELEQVVNARQLNPEEIPLLLSRLKDF